MKKTETMLKKHFCLLIFTLVFSAVVLSAAPVRAEYPEKPVEMTLLFGGTANAIGHLLSDLMGDELGQSVVAVSRTGAGGAVGYTYVKETPADGYNLVFNSNSISTATHRGNIPFDYTAFDPVARISIEVPALGVSEISGWKNLNDFIKAAQGKKGKMKIGISGKGAFTHLASAILFESMGLGDKVIYIPYGKGKGPAELLAGRIDAALQWPGQFKSFVDAGKLNVIAVTSGERVELLPDAPTAKEQGFDVDVSMWRGLAVPKGTPQERIEILEKAALKATQSAQFIKASKEIGFVPAFLPAVEFGQVIGTDDVRIAQKIKELGLGR